jgi:hypothetical protein
MGREGVMRLLIISDLQDRTALSRPIFAKPAVLPAAIDSQFNLQRHDVCGRRGCLCA